MAGPSQGSRGLPLRWTPEARASLSRVSPEDVASARALWRRCVPKRLRKLLDARAR